jgi:hypothetical protein
MDENKQSAIGFGNEEKKIPLDEQTLNQLIKEKASVRIKYERGEMYLGKMYAQDGNYIHLKPYIILENLPWIGGSIERLRIETKYSKDFPKKEVSIYALSKEYFLDFIEITNYFNSLKIKNNELRKQIFNKKLYLMPRKEKISLIERELIPSKIVIAKSMDEISKYLKRPDN